MKVNFLHTLVTILIVAAIYVTMNAIFLPPALKKAEKKGYLRGIYFGYKASSEYMYLINENIAFEHSHPRNDFELEYLALLTSYRSYTDSAVIGVCNRKTDVLSKFGTHYRKGVLYSVLLQTGTLFTDNAPVESYNWMCEAHARQWGHPIKNRLKDIEDKKLERKKDLLEFLEEK